MRALITGGAGFIGSHLAEGLLAGGHQVTVIDDLSTGRFENIAHLTEHECFDFAIASISNEVVLDRLASQCDVIFHLAAAVGVKLIVERPTYTIHTNINGTESVLKAAARYRARVLLASTSEVYGKGVQPPFHEDDDVVLGPTSRSRWVYAATKMVDEFLGLAYYHEQKLPVVVFRLFNTVGPRQSGRYGMVLPRFVGQALRGEPLTIYSDGSQSRCFCDVQDVVPAIMGLAEHPAAPGQVFNVGGNQEIRILDLARQVLRVLGKDPQHPEAVRFIPFEEAYAPGFEDMQRRVPDTTRVRELLHWQPRILLEETIKRVAESIKHTQKSNCDLTRNVV